MRNWSELPTDLLISVARRLAAFSDRASFSGVCRNWSSLAKSEINYLPRNPPWLMLAEKPDSEMRTFVCADGNEPFDLQLPETRGSRCVGSSGCWLVMIDAVCEMYILNTFSRAKIDLPPVRSFRGFIINSEDYLMMRDHYVHKVTLSFPKSQSDDFIAVALYDPERKLAYAKNGDKSWELIESGDNRFMDVIFYRDKFYTVNTSGIILVFNIDENIEKPTIVPISDPLMVNGTRSDQRFLVESGGLILQAVKVNYLWGRHLQTKPFMVSKLDLASGEWVEVNDLGRHSIFLGRNTCVALLATSSSTFRPNRIYFTHNNLRFWVSGVPIDGGYVSCNVSFFSLAKAAVVPDYTSLCTSAPWPVWIIPTSLPRNL